ncbi:phosphopantetheine-binding protein [Actinoalloteichus sp. AHMU CJ021]|uniref:acyl carrier protein n=1 Tax=Actinoalloteichus sp. AHMU CJ021 TaxID=2072503 RepID=UPI003FCC31EB
MAASGSDAAVVAMATDLAGLRAQAQAGILPPIWRSLVRTPSRRALRRQEETTAVEWGVRLTAMSAEDRHREVLALVRAKVSAVLGHQDLAEVDAQRPFKDLGFDSLTAVELRNTLTAACWPGGVVVGLICRRMPSSGGVSGWRLPGLRVMPPGWVWRPPGTRCSARSFPPTSMTKSC